MLEDRPTPMHIQEPPPGGSSVRRRASILLPSFEGGGAERTTLLLATGLLLAFVLLLPAEPQYNAPLLVLAALGGWRVISRRTRIGAPENRFLGIAFLCMWLPMLASLPDAVKLDEALRKTASLGIYYFAGLYVIAAYSRARFRDLDRLMMCVAAVCALWCLDAFWQFAFGRDWLGIPFREGDQLRGPFVTKGRLGILLVVFSPLVFEAVRRAARYWPWSPVFLLPFFAAILLAGNRTSWVALAVAGAGYLLFLLRWPEGPRRNARRTLAAGAVVLAVVLSAYAWSDGVKSARETVEPRIEHLAGLWSGDREQFELATTCRLTLWKAAVNTWSEHWLNGVGPRGFRYVYDEFRPERDYFRELCKRSAVPVSPHLLVLEIAAETGMIGLLGYLLLGAALLAGLGALDRGAFRSAYPYALVSLVTLFPVTGHLGFYGTFPTNLIWWALIVNASAFAIAARKDREDAPG